LIQFAGYRVFKVVTAGCIGQFSQLMRSVAIDRQAALTGQLGATYGNSIFSVDCRYPGMQMTGLND
jgi:hypothetical protein